MDLNLCFVDFTTQLMFADKEDFVINNYEEIYHNNSSSANVVGSNNYLNSDKKFPCPTCPSVFRQKASLTRHLKYECLQPPRFQCPYCNHRSKKTSDIYVHVRRRHPECKVFAIDIHGDVDTGNVHRMP